MRNVIQFASGFAALGCRLNFDTSTGEMEVVDAPKDQWKVIQNALADISRFEDTANYSDGLAVFALADEINGIGNPLVPAWRFDILHHILDYVDGDGRFYKQNLNTIKTQRSWHSSETPNSCSLFGEACTNRGVDIPDGRPGRKSERSPDQYHKQSTKGIGREQLVTPALNALYASIPEGRLANQNMRRAAPIDIESAIQKMTPEQVAALVERLQARIPQ